MSDYWNEDGEQISDEDLEQMTDEYIDSLHGDTVDVAGYTFTTSRVLKQLDPLAWQEQQDLMVYGMAKDGTLLYEEPEKCEECGEVITDDRVGLCEDCEDVDEEED